MKLLQTLNQERVNQDLLSEVRTSRNEYPDAGSMVRQLMRELRELRDAIHGMDQDEIERDLDSLVNRFDSAIVVGRKRMMKPLNQKTIGW